ncbi:hypothetical protein EDD86DRAFT_255580 [Gorgonomyces haynaldii]|nr:hypothetical protein EDD86DRAFT_255580 [Gorgonomyces haynaldii]
MELGKELQKHDPSLILLEDGICTLEWLQEQFDKFCLNRECGSYLDFEQYQRVEIKMPHNEHQFMTQEWIQKEQHRVNQLLLQNHLKLGDLAKQHNLDLGLYSTIQFDGVLLDGWLLSPYLVEQEADLILSQLSELKEPKALKSILETNAPVFKHLWPRLLTADGQFLGFYDESVFVPRIFQDRKKQEALDSFQIMGYTENTDIPGLVFGSLVVADWKLEEWSQVAQDHLDQMQCFDLSHLHLEDNPKLLKQLADKTSSRLFDRWIVSQGLLEKTVSKMKEMMENGLKTDQITLQLDLPQPILSHCLQSLESFQQRMERVNRTKWRKYSRAFAEQLEHFCLYLKGLSVFPSETREILLQMLLDKKKELIDSVVALLCLDSKIEAFSVNQLESKSFDWVQSLEQMDLAAFEDALLDFQSRFLIDPFVYDHSNLLERIQRTQDPPLLLHLTVLYLFYQKHAALVHCSGKHLLSVIPFLDPWHSQKLLLIHSQILQSLRDKSSFDIDPLLDLVQDKWFENKLLQDPVVQSLIQKLNSNIVQMNPDPKTHSWSISQDEILCFLVGYHREQPVACGAIRQVDSDMCEVKRMFVDSQVRRCGFGSRLLQRLEKEAVRHGFHNMVLETGVEFDAAIALYKKHGFEEIPLFGEYVHKTTSVCLSKRLQ